MKIVEAKKIVLIPLFKVLKNSKLYENAIINNPSAAALSDLTISHCLTYINKIKYGLLSCKEERKLGLSGSKRLSERSFLAVNGTLLTANLAIKNGIGCHLAGGHTIPILIMAQVFVYLMILLMLH